jgi:hypothetical protein
MKNFTAQIEISTNKHNNNLTNKFHHNHEASFWKQT